MRPPTAIVAPSFSAMGMYDATFSCACFDTTGPRSVDASRPWPIFIFFARPTSLSMTSFATPLCAMTRDAAVHRCPEVPNADHRIPSIERSMSASSSTTIAFFPPSSADTRFS